MPKKGVNVTQSVLSGQAYSRITFWKKVRKQYMDSVFLPLQISQLAKSPEKFIV
jgi:hypothetical protein